MFLLSAKPSRLGQTVIIAVIFPIYMSVLFCSVIISFVKWTGD